jgi:putative flippase GtrA
VQISILLRENTSNTFIQLFRYTIVGGIAFIIDFSSLFAFTEFLDFHYLFSAALAFTLGLITNYSLSVSWVFDKRSVQNRHKEFVAFTLIGLMGLLFNEFFMWFFTEIVAFHYLISKLCSTFFVYAWNFTVRKLLLFR